MVRKGQVNAGHLSHYTEAGPADASLQGAADEDLGLEEGMQTNMEQRDGSSRQQLPQDNQPYHGNHDEESQESLLRRTYGGFGVGMHAQGFPLGYRAAEDVVGQREDLRNVMHRPYEQREALNAHQSVDPMRWSREEEEGYAEDTANKQLAVAQMMAEMHQGNVLQQRSSNLMMVAATQMGQGRYHPDFLQAGGRMLFGAPPPRVSTDERFPSYQAEMMRQNQAMMFGMAPPPTSAAIEKGRSLEEILQQQRGMMMDMAARGMGDSRMQDFYLGRGGMVDHGAREGTPLRNHADYGPSRVGMMMGMGHEGWRNSTDTADIDQSDELRNDEDLDGVDEGVEQPNLDTHITESRREEQYIERPDLPHAEEHSPDSTPGMSNIIQPNHVAPERLMPQERLAPPERIVPRVPESVNSNLPMPGVGVGPLGNVRDTVAEMILAMERRDREKMQTDGSASEESSSSEQSDSESETDDHLQGHLKPKQQSIPAQVSPSEVDETSKVLHPIRNDPKLPQDPYSQESGSESDDSSTAHENDLLKNLSSVSSEETFTKAPSFPSSADPALSINFPKVDPISSILPAIAIKEEDVDEDDYMPPEMKQKPASSSNERRGSDHQFSDKNIDVLPDSPKRPKIVARRRQRKTPNPRPKSPDSDESFHTLDIKSVRMPMWKWIGPKQAKSSRITRQSSRKGTLKIRLKNIMGKQPLKKRGRRRKVTAVPVTTETIPTAVPCAHPTSKRRGKVFQRVVMEDMVMMDGEIMTVNKPGRPRKHKIDENKPKRKVGRPRKDRSLEPGPAKKRRPRKPAAERRKRKPQMPKTVKLISNRNGDKEMTAEERSKMAVSEDSSEKKRTGGGVSGKDFGCPFCGKEFRCGFRLNRHMQSHIPKDAIEAAEGAEGSGGSGGIQMQLALTPDREKRMVRFDQCPYCKHLFMDLKAHVRRVHTESEEHLCSICGHVLRNKESLVAHEKRHKVIASGKKEFICKECGADFYFQTGLNQHSKRHLVERACVCDLCGKAFKTTKDLEKHKLAHTKPHSCPICKRRFGQKSNMNAHMRQHSGDKPFRCQLCSASFTHNVSLKTHMKNTHGIDWWKEHGKKEEVDEKMVIMNACLDYFGNTGTEPPPNKWESSSPPNPNPTKWENSSPPNPGANRNKWENSSSPNPNVHANPSKWENASPPNPNVSSNPDLNSNKWGISSPPNPNPIANPNPSVNKWADSSPPNPNPSNHPSVSSPPSGNPSKWGMSSPPPNPNPSHTPSKWGISSPPPNPNPNPSASRWDNSSPPNANPNRWGNASPPNLNSNHHPNPNLSPHPNPNPNPHLNLNPNPTLSPHPNPNYINPLNPLNPLNPANPLNHMGQFNPSNHNPMGQPNLSSLYGQFFNPMSALNAMHPNGRPHLLEDIKPSV